MFETSFNAIIISVMVLVHCNNPVIIRKDRVYRYVGNGSDGLTFADSLSEDSEHEMQSEESLSQRTDIDHENIPESLLIQIKNMRNASDFIANFLMSDNNPKHKDVYLDYLERGSSGNDSEKEINVNEERRKLTNLPNIGVPAGCVPEMRIVELKPNDSHSELYFPSCVRMSRCSGCCPSKRLHCVPISTSYEDISVIRVKYSPIEKRLKFEGFKVFRIEKHDKCNCDCIQKESDCSPNQIYSESECRCLCPNTSLADECPKNYNKYWDYSDCLCKCKSVPFCSTGLVFDNTTCRCGPEPTTSPTKPVKRIGWQRLSVNKHIDTELESQNNKGLNVFKTKGINPDIDEDYRENNDS